MSDESFECGLCGNEFDLRDEIEEHLVYNHEVLDRRIIVHDPENAEPEGV